MANDPRLLSLKEAVLECIRSKKSVKLGSLTAIYAREGISELFEESPELAESDYSVTRLFQPRQGVTWGGEGCDEVFIVDENTFNELTKDPQALPFLRKTTGGRDIAPWKIDWQGKYLLFPYLSSQSKWIPCFYDPQRDRDSLDLETSFDSYESTHSSPEERLDNRIAQGLVNSPAIAKYLVKYYSKLEGRVFKDRSLRSFNKQWYEFIWPRDPSLVSAPKIIARRLMPLGQACFALDIQGYLPRDSVIALLPKENLSVLRKELEEVLSEKVDLTSAIVFVLNQLNSEEFANHAKRKRSIKRGGARILDEKMLNSFVIRRPKELGVKKTRQYLEPP